MTFPSHLCVIQTLNTVKQLSLLKIVVFDYVQVLSSHCIYLSINRLNKHIEKVAHKKKVNERAV